MKLLHLVTLCILLSFNAAAQRNILNGIIYFPADSVISATDTLGVEMPQKNKPVRLVSNPYTARQKIKEKIEPQIIDSLVLWNRTAPSLTHALEYIHPYGWCWLLDRGAHISIYNYSPKGYYIGGNGGMWAKNKSVILVKKGNTFHRFTKTFKLANNKFRERLAALVADDPVLVKMILQSSFLREKTLRMLSLYSPAI
ncbi:MAG: hypothetical protein K2M11_05930 [Paramuribaculum sp.]|nr:hypothetical protein [Paramuribaculum sp.]